MGPLGIPWVTLNKRDQIEDFMGKVSVSQHLLSEKMLTVTQSKTMYDTERYTTEMEFELLLFKSVAAAGGSN